MIMEPVRDERMLCNERKCCEIWAGIFDILFLRFLKSVWHWINYLTSLNLNFPISKVGMLPDFQYREDSTRYSIIQQVVIEHLLCVRYYARCERQNHPKVCKIDKML